VKFDKDKNRHMLQNAAKRLLKHFRPNWQARLQRDISREVQRGVAIRQTDFPASLSLPEKYGRGLPERVVELLLAQLLYQPGCQVLDVGHANAMTCHLEMIKALPSPRNITGIDIAQPGYDVSGYYQDSIQGDIANTGFESNQFHRIWCISALEHFGMDNSGYTDEFSMDSGLAPRALLEMLRILKQGGQILITVPFGKYEDHGWFINYDSEHWQSLLNIARPKSTIHELYFRHTFGSGWTVATADELRQVGYFDQSNHGASGFAVACVAKV